MLKKLTIIIKKELFQLDAELNQGVHAKQIWQLADPPYSRKTFGQDWSELPLSAEMIRGLEQAVMVTARFSRHLAEGSYGEITLLTVDIGPGWVDALIANEHETGVLLRYEWDHFAKLREPQIVSGDLATLPETLMDDFKDATQGRYGLLARLISNQRTTPTWSTAGRQGVAVNWR